MSESNLKSLPYATSGLSEYVAFLSLLGLSSTFFASSGCFSSFLLKRTSTSFFKRLAFRLAYLFPSMACFLILTSKGILNLSLKILSIVSFKVFILASEIILDSRLITSLPFSSKDVGAFFNIVAIMGLCSFNSSTILSLYISNKFSVVY